MSGDTKDSHVFALAAHAQAERAGPNGVAGLVLAAGAGRRLGKPKGLVRDRDGRAWVDIATAALRDGGCSPVVLVVGAQGREVAALAPADVQVVFAPEWAQGLSASLKAGLHFVSAHCDPTCQAVMISPVDTPGVGPSVVSRLLARARAGTERLTGVLLRAGYAGTDGHPVLIGRDHWTPVMRSVRGDSGARTYLAEQRIDRVECADLADGADIDRPTATEP